MKAMRLEKPGPIEQAPLRLVEVPPPQPGQGQVLVRVRACGVCHTDLHTVEGELAPVKLPIIPGHEAVGVVEQCGKDCQHRKVGDRVGLAWLHATCGRCRHCQAGLENLCEQARFTGYHTDGGYAEYAVIGEDFAYRIPSGFEDAAAAPLLCAGIIGYRSLKLAGYGPGRRLGLYGFGASAHIAIQVAVYRGCEVYVFSRGEAHRALARDLGAAWTGGAEEEPPAKLDSAIIFAPVGWLVSRALGALDRGGVLALAGIYMTAIPPLDYQEHLYYERTVRSVTAATRRDGRELLELAERIPIRTNVQCFDLGQANDALTLLKQGRIDGAAVLTCA